MIIWPAKDPAASEIYAFDFTDELNGAEISGTPAVTPTGVTATGVALDGNLVRMMLSAGTAGTVAKVACNVVTSAGETIPALAVLEIGDTPVDLATAKAAQRIEGDDEDALLGGLLRAAIGQVERATGKKLTPKIVSQTVDGFPGCAGHSAFGRFEPYHASAGANQQAIRLWNGPVGSILEIKYDDPDGVEQTLTSFRLVEGNNAKLLPGYGAAWPTTAVGPGTVRISYVAGYEPDALPPELTQAVILLFGHFNANREAVIASERAAAVELPLGFSMLLDEFRTPGIA